VRGAAGRLTFSPAQNGVAGVVPGGRLARAPSAPAASSGVTQDPSAEGSPRDTDAPTSASSRTSAGPRATSTQVPATKQFPGPPHDRAAIFSAVDSPASFAILLWASASSVPNRNVTFVRFLGDGWGSWS
jgi:hypothetical protein